MCVVLIDLILMTMQCMLVTRIKEERCNKQLNTKRTIQRIVPFALTTVNHYFSSWIGASGVGGDSGVGGASALYRAVKHPFVSCEPTVLITP